MRRSYDRAFVTDLRDGDEYAPFEVEGEGAWQTLLDDPEQRGDEIYLSHASDDGESPGIFDSSVMVRVRRSGVTYDGFKRGDIVDVIALRARVEDDDGDTLTLDFAPFDPSAMPIDLRPSEYITVKLSDPDPDGT